MATFEPPLVVAVMSRKGGAGKSTLAAHLAVDAAAAGREGVLMVDADPQCSLTDWWRSREAEDLRLVEHGAAGIEEVVAAAREASVGEVVIDTPPAVGREVVEIVKAADVCVVPVQPGILDLRAVTATLDLISDAGGVTLIALNRCPPRRGIFENAIVSEAQAAVRLVCEDGLFRYLAKTPIRQRQLFASAMIDGRVAKEVEPYGKAAAEISALGLAVTEALMKANGA